MNHPFILSLVNTYKDETYLYMLLEIVQALLLSASGPHEALYPTARYPTRHGNGATETYPNTLLELVQALQQPWHRLHALP
jgi:hypothetical protein